MSVVVSDRCACSAGLAMDTDTPGSTAPLSSETRPSMRALLVVAWPATTGAAHAMVRNPHAAAATAIRRIRVITDLLRHCPLCEHLFEQ